ncbi:peptidase U61 LD-carboxypeptidase A [[Clostridium] sordellii]|uniref:S66 family peptidase n=1 Tax=Paraclostridium sordellii TaxID=1505 RepID=UPI0005E6D6B3|nr:S66 peptidase family protein [Paeniclostridium sordellii]CEP97551.1 peptidase U61 LD-carboxypeptidase A [[Clostridium] sordellii] [Paeniclostridium sordellii]
MEKLIKPKALKRGDKIATVSLSWGGAGDEEILWRYKQGKKRLEEEFGFEVVEMENTLKGSDYIYKNPQKRAEDLMNAFKDKSIKGIFSCIGGNESIRILPYIDYDIIRKNPKVFIGYSDTTVSHFICLKAGISSFYGPSVLAEFAENVKMFDYTKYWFEKAIFDINSIGEIIPSDVWTSEYIPWDISNKAIQRNTYKNEGYEILQGNEIVKGRLIGGCIEVLEMIKGTEIWPSREQWENSILFIETSEDTPEPTYLEYWLRNYGSQGILNLVKGIIVGKPYDNKYYEEYKQVILKIVRDELGLKNLPIMYNMNFGHTSPIITIPYGCIGEIDCDKSMFKILEPGVR